MTAILGLILCFSIIGSASEIRRKIKLKKIAKDKKVR
jgi:hypothetical protein